MKVQNMNYMFGGDNYRNKTRVNQAPGGNTSLSLGWGDSNPYEHRRGRFDHQPVNTYGLNQSLEAQNSRYPQQPSYQQQEPKNTFNGFSALQEARRAKLQPLEDPFKRSWNDGQKFMGSNHLNGLKSPMETAYMKQKFNEEPRYEEPRDAYRGYEQMNNYQQPSTTTHYQASQYENQGRGQLRSRSQVNSLQNNARNIMNDFSSTKYAMESPKHFRATADQADKWSGIRVTNPPGGGSSLKLWG